MRPGCCRPGGRDPQGGCEISDLISPGGTVIQAIGSAGGSGVGSQAVARPRPRRRIEQLLRPPRTRWRRYLRPRGASSLSWRHIPHPPPPPGQVPGRPVRKNIRASRAWRPGTEFTIEETSDGVLLRPAGRFPGTDLDQVAGCLRSRRPPKSTAHVHTAIEREVVRRHDRGRY